MKNKIKALILVLTITIAGFTGCNRKKGVVVDPPKAAIYSTTSVTVPQIPVAGAFAETGVSTVPSVSEKVEEQVTEKEEEVVEESAAQTEEATNEAQEESVVEEAEDAPAAEVVESSSSGEYSFGEFMNMGVINWGGHRWTYYSETVLSGGGLNIPGRHVSGGYICDADGYIVLASCDYAKGTVVSTPFGRSGKIYDYCPTSGTLDVYVH